VSYPADRARRTTLAGRLARLGFADAARAERTVGELRLDDQLIGALGDAADPDLALTGLARLLPPGDGAAPGLRPALQADPSFARRLTAVLGASAALADHLTRHPGDWRVLHGAAAQERPAAAELRAALLRAVGAVPGDAEPRAALEPGTDPAVALRAAYRRPLLHLAARDLTGAATLDETAAELADLGAAALEAALAVARAQLPKGAAAARLAVIGMGKCGGRELNYASDVDVIFVAEPAAGQPEDAALRTATRLAAAMIQVCSQTTSEGAIFPVDPNLRPEGRSGPLVRTLASHRAYYERWAKTWEFQALVKARPVAGDPDLGRAYAEAITPLVWQAAQRENFVEDVQAMRRRVEQSLPAGQAGRELKLGPGGLRDIEFTVQLLQLVHGRADETLRSPATLPALAALADGGYVGRDDAAALADAYRFLRRVEHLLQLYQLRRTHSLPDDPQAIRRIGRAMHQPFLPNGRGPAPARPPADPAAEFTAQWRRHAIEVRRLHEKLFYRPLLHAAARLPGEAARLTPDAARARLEALGYTDPAGALRHIEALTAGVSRRAAIQRTLLPVLLDWFAGAAEPDAGLLAFRQVSDALGRSPWYLRLLRDDTKVAERLARILASSRYATGLLLRAPAAVAMLGDDAELAARPQEVLRAEVAAVVGRHDETEAAVTAVRAIRRRELVRIASADLLRLAEPEQVREALTSLAAVTVEAALAAAIKKVELELRGPLPTRMCVVAMGRFGGHESGYASDADVMFVHEPLPADAGPGESGEPGAAAGLGERGAAGQPSAAGDDSGPGERDTGGQSSAVGDDSGPGERGAAGDPAAAGDRGAEEATRAAHAVAEELRRLLALPAPDPPLLIDPGLRPEGRQGPLVRTLASYRAYYRRWSAGWEAQALLRAEPVAGDPGLGARFTALADEFRYPVGGIDPAALTHIRRLKARMEAERIPRGVDPALHLKLGPGGLADVEWVAQLFQLRHAYATPALRTTRTLEALDAAVTAGLLAEADRDVLAAAWQLAARIRDNLMLVRGRPSDVLPTSPPELSAVARLTGYGPGESRALLDDYRRTARRARSVMERVFYG
jgi:[glutamine synthetase] adenylyltransferase / [glutamine synthetase]-adenylyl-L-tyrosine phosphorylase